MRQAVLLSYTRTQTCRFTTSTPFPAYNTFVFQTRSANLSVSPISAMATSEHTDEVEIAASVAHSPGEPPLEPATENVSQHEGRLESTIQYTPHQRPPQNPIIPYLESMPSVVQGTEGTATTSEHSSTPGTPLKSSAVSISEVDLPYELPRHSNVSIPEDTASHQPPPPEITEEPQGIANTISAAAFTGTSEQSRQKGLLKDVFLECSSPHPFNDELTLAIMRNGNFETLRLTKISPTKWKAVENIDFHHDGDCMMLIVQSKDGGDEAFLAFTADEIYAMACAEEGAPKIVVCPSYMRLKWSCL
ncbi:hypothetical protein BDZ97DRAFT_1826140 [Flammula alnicola]|nr:hypothetical protein BDZ97DRAFT_1826140 [Flammula alnicola]